MQVTFYINTSPTVKVNKSLSSAGASSVRQCDIMGAVDVINPVIVVKGTVDSSVNYMVIGEPLNRRYFITAMDFTTAGKVIISGHVDVLSTYHGFLENTTLNYVRGAGDLTEIEDSSFPVSDYITEQHYRFNGWEDTLRNSDAGIQYILRTICGEAEGFTTVALSDGQEFRYQKWVYSIHRGTIVSSSYISFEREDPSASVPSVMNGSYIEFDGGLFKFEPSPYSSTDPELAVIVYLGTT